MSGFPEGRAGKILAVAIAVLMLSVVHFAVAAPLLAFYDNAAQQLRDRRDVLSRYQAAARDLPHLRAEVKARRERLGDGSLLFGGSSDAVAAASLQSNVKDLVEQGGATLASAQTLPVEADGTFRKIGIRVAFSGDLELLTSVLLGIEEAHPVLSVGNLEIRSNEEDGQVLGVAMDVYGIRSQ